MFNYRFFGLCFALLASSHASADDAVSVFLDREVKPHLTAYFGCADQHLALLARSNPTRSFDAVEGSLRPACGLHIDRIRNALYRAGLNRGQANQFIRSSYLSIQGQLRANYDQNASAEERRRQTDKEDAERRRQEHEAEAERERLLKEAASDHDKCLLSQMKELVPFSNESAETLAQVIVTKCSEAEKKYVSLGVAFYGGSKSDMQKLVRDAVEERKKHIVAEIVTFRANMSKELLSRQKPEADPSAKPANGI